MKTEFCSFCRTKQSPLYGLTADPDAYCICAMCLEKFSKARAKKLAEACCFCAESGKTGYAEKSSGAVICTDCLQKYVEQTRVTPIPTKPLEEVMEVNIQWPTYFDASMDLIEVQVRLHDGKTLSANFTTPPRITWEMEKGRRSGQWADGTYYCHPDLIFVEELTEDRIRRAIQDMSKTGLLKKVFK